MKSLTLILLVFVALVSCKKDKDTASPNVLALKAQLLGKWQLDSAKYEIFDLTNVKIEEKVEKNQAITLQLNNEGSGALIRPALYGPFVNGMRNDLVLKVSAEVDGNYLTAVNAKDIEPKLKINTISQTKLKTTSDMYDINIVAGIHSQKSHGLIVTSWYTRTQ